MANEVHDIILVGDSRVLGIPTNDNNITNKEYVDSRLGYISILSITPTSTGAVAAPVYVSSIPQDISIAEIQTNTLALTVTLELHLYDNTLHPSVNILTSTGTTLVTLSATNVDRTYSGQADITITNSEHINILCLDNKVSSSVFINYISTLPTVNSVVLGSYPNSQIELKESDILPIVGTVHNDAIGLTVVADAVATSLTNLSLGPKDGISPGIREFSADVIIGNGIGVNQISFKAINIFGDVGPVFLSPTILMNQDAPIIVVGAIQYPVGKTGLLGGEQVTVEASITSYDTLDYWSSTALSVTSPLIYSPVKVLTAAAGIVETGVVNYTITATKTSNGATTIQEFSLNVADVAPSATMSIVGNPQFLLSSPQGEQYDVELIPDQILNFPPSVTASAGILVLDPWILVGDVWTNTIVVVDGFPNGLNSFTATMTGTSGLIGTSLNNASYTLKGLAARDITIPRFTREIPIGAHISDITKVSASIKGSSSQLILKNDTLDASDGFTITDGSGVYSNTGAFLYINDPIVYLSNASGTMQITLQELAV